MVGALMTTLRSATVDTLLTALSHPRRRYTVSSLISQPQLTVEKLASEVASYERTQADPGEAPELTAVSVSLVHTHLPQLADAGLIEYDARSGAIRRPQLDTSRWTFARQVLELEQEFGDEDLPLEPEKPTETMVSSEDD